MVITEQKIKASFTILIITLFMSACSDASQNKGASWKGALNFMHVTKDSMQMTYSVDVMGQKVFLDGYYEITLKNTDEVIFRLVFNLLFASSTSSTNPENPSKGPSMTFTCSPTS